MHVPLCACMCEWKPISLFHLPCISFLLFISHPSTVWPCGSLFTVLPRAALCLHPPCCWASFLLRISLCISTLCEANPIFSLSVLLLCSKCFDLWIILLMSFSKCKWPNYLFSKIVSWLHCVWITVEIWLYLHMYMFCILYIVCLWTPYFVNIFVEVDSYI